VYSVLGGAGRGSGRGAGLGRGAEQEQADVRPDHEAGRVSVSPLWVPRSLNDATPRTAQAHIAACAAGSRIRHPVTPPTASHKVRRRGSHMLDHMLGHMAPAPDTRHQTPAATATRVGRAGRGPPLTTDEAPAGGGDAGGGEGCQDQDVVGVGVGTQRYLV
jgi:hypothetical protein